MGISFRQIDTISSGIKEDCEAIISMFKEFIVYQMLDTDKVVDLKELQDIGFDEQCSVFRLLVAENSADKQIVGFILYYTKYSLISGKGIWMDDLYVSQQCRGSGMGRALMSALAKQAANKSYDYIDWRCLSWNTSALSFYKHMGSINISETYGIYNHKFALFGAEGLRLVADNYADNSIFTVRKYRTEDWHELNQLFNNCLKYEKQEIDRSKPLEMHEFNEQLDIGLFRVFVAQLKDNNNKSLIGFVLFYQNYWLNIGKGVWIEHMYVEDEYKNLDVSDMLMTAVAKHTVQHSGLTMGWAYTEYMKQFVDSCRQLCANYLRDNSNSHLFHLNNHHLIQLINLDN
ncbi:uncharacterized protein LOC128954040 [Oppia nitens]|uniref:uncharacterized protein LOC128954040 n=1 Tax=Oppia nitens TaxID=1686743 RepID=UPI0023DA1A35|nr:uncharacterized protein LOC128954040 [Oppia nitens]